MVNYVSSCPLLPPSFSFPSAGEECPLLSILHFFCVSSWARTVSQVWVGVESLRGWVAFFRVHTNRVHSSKINTRPHSYCIIALKIWEFEAAGGITGYQCQYSKCCFCIQKSLLWELFSFKSCKHPASVTMSTWCRINSGPSVILSINGWCFNNKRKWSYIHITVLTQILLYVNPCCILPELLKHRNTFN